MLRDIWSWVEEGRKHDIPWCCGLRFGIDWERPKLGWVLPHPFLRPWVRSLRLFPGPRGAFALYDGQGYVPCEFHLALYVLTGWRPTIRQDEDGDAAPVSSAPSD